MPISGNQSRRRTVCELRRIEDHLTQSHAAIVGRHYAVYQYFKTASAEQFRRAAKQGIVREDAGGEPKEI